MTNSDELKLITENPAFELLRHKAKIYVGYEDSNRYVHSHATKNFGLRIIREKGLSSMLDEDKYSLVALGHDLFTFPTAHPAEEVVEKFLEQKWDHAMQTVYMLRYIYDLDLPICVYDAIAHHRKLCKTNYLVKEPETVEEILQNTGNNEAAFLCGLILKAADEIDNCFQDPIDAENSQVDISSVLPIRERLGIRRKDFERNVLKGINVTENSLSFEDDLWDDICQLKIFAYEHIHKQARLLHQRKTQSLMIRQTLEGLEHIIKEGKYLGRGKKGFICLQVIDQYIAEHGDKYEKIAQLPFVNSSIEKWIAKDIFSLRDDTNLNAFWQSIGQLAVGDPKIDEIFS